MDENFQRRRTDPWYAKLALAVTTLWDWLDKRQVLRRVAFVWVLWLTGQFAAWTMDFASHSPRGGVDVAAIIAAVWAPMGLLQAAVFKFYDEGPKT